MVFEINGRAYSFADYRQDEGLRIRREAICPTITAHMAHKDRQDAKPSGIVFLIEEADMKINNATTKGYAEVGEGEVEDLAFPESTTRRARVIDNGKTTPTLDTSCEVGYLEHEGKEIRIRKLTPRECFRLQGFPDEYFERAAAVNSDTQLYKQAGNSVTVNVIYEFAKRFKRDEEVEIP